MRVPPWTLLAVLHSLQDSIGDKHPRYNGCSVAIDIWKPQRVVAVASAVVLRIAAEMYVEGEAAHGNTRQRQTVSAAVRLTRRSE